MLTGRQSDTSPLDSSLFSFCPHSKRSDFKRWSVSFSGHKVTFNLPATTNTYYPMNSGGGDSAMTSPMGPGTPESPFSPEIQNILDDGGMSGSGVSGGMSSVFRSHSVPVQDMLGCAGK